MKAYVKPELFYERYELSQHIANCDIEMDNSTDANNCVGIADGDLELGAAVFFVDSNTLCLTPPLEYFCYFNGAEGNGNTFMS